MLLETTDIPISFRGPGRVAIGIAGILALLLLAWGTFAPISSGAVAPGEIIPAGRTKTIQHLEGGIIRAIHVKDGDHVAAGQELMILDDTEAGAALGIVITEETAQQALVARLTAERDGTKLPAMPTSSPSVDTQIRLFEARREAQRKEIEGLQQRARDARVELAGWQAKDVHLKALSANAEEESRINRDLYEQKFISKPRLLQLESHRSEANAAIAENAAEIGRARQKITDAEIAIAKLKNDWLNNLLEELRRAQDNLASAKERVQVARDRMERTHVTAPQDGIVNGLRYMTIGGVIPPGGLIMEVTPSSEKPVVEAHLSPDDIDVVHTGLPARIRLSAYKARWHFALKGSVTSISSDTFKDDKTGHSYYKVQVEIPEAELNRSDRTLLVPGMLAQVEIITGERSALRYLLDPLIESFQRSMKEE